MLSLLMVLLIAQIQPDFQYEVLRSKIWKDEPGLLSITSSGIDYRSTNGKTSMHLPFIDIREIDLSDPGAIRIETYEMLKRKLSGRRMHTFRLRRVRGIRHDENLVKFLSDKISRPVLASYRTAAEPEFDIPAYHRHVLSGCNGTIQITPDGIHFRSENEEHSRTWLYSEIQTIGSSHAFSFRITTLAENYAFDLKEPLAEKAYELVWRQVYGLPSKYSNKGSRTLP